MRFARFRDSNIKGINLAPAAPAPFQIRFNVSSVSGVAAGTSQITATVLDQYNATYNGATIVWTSSNTAIATVNASGLVTFVAKGTAVITASIAVTRAAKSITATTN